MSGCCRRNRRPDQENEHVLHHWRGRRGDCDRRLFGAALITRLHKAEVLFSAAIEGGRSAVRPAGAIGGWLAILAPTWRRISKDNLSTLAAGAAFQALLSIFPTLTAAVSLYGLVADPNTVERQISTMRGVLPPEALTLLATWLEALVQGPATRFGLGLVVGVLLAVWSMWSLTSMLMTAVNLCYGEEESRGFVSFNLHALALGAGLALFGIAALTLMAVLPAALALLPLSAAWGDVLGLVRWPIMAVLAILALAALYRYGPDRADPKWQWISWGSVAATALWIVGSIAFTIYVSKVGSYDRTYGSLGAVIILLLWFYLTAYVILAGAELNAEIERRTTGRSTVPALDPVCRDVKPGFSRPVIIGFGSSPSRCGPGLSLPAPPPARSIMTNEGTASR